MEHVFINKNHPFTLVMLHGTGGDEIEMAKFASQINNELNILSIRGNVSEGGMNRYFKRFKMGLYDLPNYIMETKNLNNSIIKYFSDYNLDLTKAIVIGFSNGANIALGLIQDFPETIKNYVLLSPDHINKEKPFKALNNLNIFMSLSKNDPYSSYPTLINLQKELIKAGSNMESYLVLGHMITTDLVLEIKKYLLKIIK